MVFSDSTANGTLWPLAIKGKAKRRQRKRAVQIEFARKMRQYNMFDVSTHVRE